MKHPIDNESLYSLLNQAKMKGLFIDFVRKYYNLTFPQLSRTSLRKLFLLFFVAVAYIFYKHRKQRCRKVFKRTERNIDIINNLLPIIKNYKPTPYLPWAIVQILYGELVNKQLYEFEKEVITLPDDGELLLEWFPNNFAEMDPQTPIIIFNFGVCGTSKDSYYQILCNHISKKNWRMVAVNRRGFGFNHLKSTKFIYKNETADLDFVSNRLKEIYPQANLYMMGVSAGANHAANYLGKIKDNTPIKAFVGISNPFNVGRISFTMKHNIWGAFYSRLIARNMKELYRFHFNNHHFQHIVKHHKLNIDTLEKKLEQKETCWEIDKFLTHKLGGFDTVYDYYIDISSEHVIEDIKVPSLFISNEEDPICLKENIPIEKIYKNENTILLFMERGGHVEYFSGYKAERWCYDAALHYLDYFEQSETAK